MRIKAVCRWLTTGATTAIYRVEVVEKVAVFNGKARYTIRRTGWWSKHDFSMILPDDLFDLGFTCISTTETRVVTK